MSSSCQKQEKFDGRGIKEDMCSRFSIRKKRIFLPFSFLSKEKMGNKW